MFLYIHRDHQDYWGRGAQDGHLDFHAAPELGAKEGRVYIQYIAAANRDIQRCQTATW